MRRRVRQQHHVLDAEVAQNLRAYADFDLAALARALLLSNRRLRGLIHSETLWAGDRGSTRSRRGPRPRSCLHRVGDAGVAALADAHAVGEHVDCVHAHQDGARLFKSPLTSARCSPPRPSARRHADQPPPDALLSRRGDGALDDAVVAQTVADRDPRWCRSSGCAAGSG